MGEMGVEGMGKIGGNGESSTDQDGKCRYHFRSGRKKGGNGSKLGGGTYFFGVPFPPFFRRSKTFPTFPFVKTKSPQSPKEKWGTFPLSDTYHHSS